MAKEGFGFCVILFSFASSVFSRVILPETTILDISASIQKTIDVLSFNPDLLQEEQQQDNENEQSDPDFSSSSFTVKIQSRDTLLKPTHKDYKALTIDRLERDSARVKSITSKLDLASTDGILKPRQNEDIAGPVSSGVKHGSGEYFARVGVGSPPKPQCLILDTVSDISWLQCAPCMQCYNQTGPIFEPSYSTSFSYISCGTQLCRSLGDSGGLAGCSNKTCRYLAFYGDGSYTVGEFVTETLMFDTSRTSLENIYIGCGHDNRGLFTGAAGLLALGRGAVSFPSQVNATAFSYCIVDRDSNFSSDLQFGSGTEPADAITAPLLSHPLYPTFYYVNLTGISVGGQLLNLPQSVFDINPSIPSGVIVDTGTGITRLRADVYLALRDAFVKATYNLTSAGGFALFDTCYDLSLETLVSVPAVAFWFPGGKSLVLPAKNLLVPVDDKKTFCFAFAASNSEVSIIGNLQQQGIRVSFNIATSVVGFSPNRC
ncbi:hypothetical protein C5167_027528 [Papaver somniferum]|nr:hypothetical protein C5167_027528 [Papaver somniferum]